MSNMKNLDLCTVQNCLDNISQFLIPCLPLANAHASDFITMNHWNILIPTEIQEELLTLNEEQLKHLLSDVFIVNSYTENTCVPNNCSCDGPSIDQLDEPSMMEAVNGGLSEIQEYCRCECPLIGKDDESRVETINGGLSAIQEYGRCECPLIDKDDEPRVETITGVLSKLYEIPGQNPKKNPKRINKHVTPSTAEGNMEHNQDRTSHVPYSSLADFFKASRSCTLEETGLAASSHDLLVDMDVDKVEVFVGTYMSEKKSHEVEIMSSVCATLAQRAQCNLVIDFGSGKGYLGNHLCLQYGFPVLGIDAAPTNTQSAERRNTVVDKQWKSLTRNTIMESQGRKLTKREKKKLKLQAKLCRSMGNLNLSDNAESDETSKLLPGFETGENMDCVRDAETAGTIPSAVQEKSLNKIVNINELYTTSDCLKEVETAGTVYTEVKVKPLEKAENIAEVNKLVNIDKSQEALYQAKFVPCTTFIDKNTDFLDLARMHFPDFSAFNYETVHVHNKFTDSKTKSLTSENVDVEIKLDISDVCNSCGCLSPHSKDCYCAQNCGIDVLYIGACPSKQENTNSINNMKSEESVHNIVSKFKAEDRNNVDIGNECNLMLIGLHTCGNLASTSMEVFAHSDQLKVLCNVGCCYHLIDERYMDRETTDAQHGFPLSNYLNERRMSLGNTARNLASQSAHRDTDSGELQGHRFYPRALLEVLMQDMCGEDGVTVNSLRKLEQKCKSVQEYIRRACDKLGISEKVSDEKIEHYMKKYENDRHKLAAFFQLKIILAPCIEALIILDRVCFLLEQSQIKDVILVKMFDPVISPRCYGIVAIKAAI